MPSGVSSCEGDKRSKFPKVLNLALAGLRISARLDNKTRQKYGLFSKISLSVIGACEMDKNPHIFITRANQYIHKNNRHFDGTVNNFGPVLFAENLEQNEYYSFKAMLF